VLTQQKLLQTNKLFVTLLVTLLLTQLQPQRNSQRYNPPA